MDFNSYIKRTHQRGVYVREREREEGKGNEGEGRGKKETQTDRQTHMQALSRAMIICDRSGC